MLKVIEKLYGMNKNDLETLHNEFQKKNVLYVSIHLSIHVRIVQFIIIFQQLIFYLIILIFLLYLTIFYFELL